MKIFKLVTLAAVTLMASVVAQVTPPLADVTDKVFFDISIGE